LRNSLAASGTNQDGEESNTGRNLTLDDLRKAAVFSPKAPSILLQINPQLATLLCQQSGCGQRHHILLMRMVCSVGHVTAFTFYALLLSCLTYANAALTRARPFFIPAKVEVACLQDWARVCAVKCVRSQNAVLHRGEYVCNGVVAAACVRGSRGMGWFRV
jgi:hypothetical protein